MSLYRNTSRSGASTEDRVEYQSVRRDSCLNSRRLSITHESIEQATKEFKKKGGKVKRIPALSLPDFNKAKFYERLDYLTWG